MVAWTAGLGISDITFFMATCAARWLYAQRLLLGNSPKVLGALDVWHVIQATTDNSQVNPRDTDGVLCLYEAYVQGLHVRIMTVSTYAPKGWD